MLGQDIAGASKGKGEDETSDARKSLEAGGESGAYVDFVPPWKESDRKGEPLTAVDHFVSIGNVVVLDEEHMNEWLHQQDLTPGDSHAFSRERHGRNAQRQYLSNCKCFTRPNGLSDCCLTNTSGQSMIADDCFPLPWVEHNSDDVPQKHMENWSYSCPSEANKSQFDHGTHPSMDQLTNPEDCHFDLTTLHKHQNRLHHHRHHQSNHCGQPNGLQQLEQYDLKERVHKWLMGIDRSIPDFESIDEIT